MVTPYRTTASPGTVNSQLPPCSPAMSTITLPGFMLCTISAVISLGAGLPGISAVVMMMSTSLAWLAYICLLYTSDAADDLLCVDLGGRRIIKKKKKKKKKKTN